MDEALIVLGFTGTQDNRENGSIDMIVHLNRFDFDFNLRFLCTLSFLAFDYGDEEEGEGEILQVINGMIGSLWRAYLIYPSYLHTEPPPA